MPPTKTGDRPRFTTHRLLRRIARVLWGHFGPTMGYPHGLSFPSSTSRATVPLTPLSRSFSMPGCTFSRCADPTQKGSPRPLPLRRRDATKLFPVQDAFVRQEMCCSSSALSSGDCTPSPDDDLSVTSSREAHASLPNGSFLTVRADTSRVAHEANRVSALLSPLAPLATRSFAAGGFVR